MSSAKMNKMLSKAAAEMGRKGGKARAKAIGKKRVSEIGRAGAMKRWYIECPTCCGYGLQCISRWLAPRPDAPLCERCAGTGRLRKDGKASAQARKKARKTA